jgi:hypothetical protein
VTATHLDMFRRFRERIAGASESEIRSDPTLRGRLLLAHKGPVTVSYAPFDYVTMGARVVIVGITPGAQQATNALISARSCILAGRSDEETLATAKVFASFSGPMRSNLVAMLDHVGLAARIGVRTCASLWSTDVARVHFTSALRYPVFVAGANYVGQPRMMKTPVLRAILREYLVAEARAVSEAVWIPLGRPAAEGLREMVRIGALLAAQVLEGLPHPSGANSERIAYFLGRKARAALSSKTNPTELDRVRDSLVTRIGAVSGGGGH